MERSKAGTLVCSAWVFGMLPGTGQALGKAPVGEQGCACFPPPLRCCTKWAVPFHHLVVVRREEGKGCHTGISRFSRGRELTLLICMIKGEISFV